MYFMVRMILFLCINLSVILLFGSVLSLLRCNSDHIFTLIIITGIFGIIGSMISLYLSKSIALSAVNGKIISIPSNEIEDWLLRIVQNQACTLNIIAPQLAIYDSFDMNAFATGPNKNESLIVVTTGLIKNMTRKSIEAVIAHEMNHIAYGDMITMTLIQGIINTFIFFIAHSFSQLIVYGISILYHENGDIEHGNDRKYYLNNITNSLVYIIISSILELLFGMIARIFMLWFSRSREFFADARATKLVGCDNMISALQELQYDTYKYVIKPINIKTLYIHTDSNHIENNNIINNLFSSHPSLKKRIQALQNGVYLHKSSYFF